MYEQELAVTDTRVDDPVVPKNLEDWDDSAWDIEPEPSPVGPQGVLLAKDEYVDPDAVPDEDSAEIGTLPFTDEEEFASPEERAQTRFNRLSTAFSATLVIVAQMYRDEDWRYLRKDDGTPYKSLVEVCQVAMGKSVAMARRYVQGARDFYLPLSAVMVEGTRLEITSGDVATLGTDGIKSVVDEASERLREVDDPEEASSIVNETLQSAREERERGRREAESEDEGWDNAEAREYYEPPEPDALGPLTTHLEGDEDDDFPTVTTPGSESSEVAGAAYFVGDEDDLISPLLDGAPLFDNDESLDRLPVPVKRVVRAMLVLQNADVAEIARALDYDNRGIIVHGDAAQKTLTRIRAMAETQPWVMKSLGDTD